MPKVLILQHITCETPGTIETALVGAGIEWHIHRSYEGQPGPSDIGVYDGLIVMGGPMGVYEYDRYAFLTEEIGLIQQALTAEKPILGVCLGSQLLASALGAEVKPGRAKEIGWYPLRLTEAANDDALWQGIASPFMGFHWHGDVFDVPAGAVSLASSEMTSCQAFRYGTNAYGFLFHMEVTATIIGDLVSTFADELQEASIDGEQILQSIDTQLTPLQQIGARVFKKWAGLVVDSVI